MIGSLTAGALASRFSRKWMLAVIYADAGLPSPSSSSCHHALSCLIFGAALGLLWLSTVRPHRASSC